MFSKTITTEDPIYEAVLSFKNNNYSMKGDFYGRTYNYVHAIVFDVIPDEQAVAGIITGVYEMIYNYIGTLDDPQMFYVWAGSIATDAAFSYVYNNSPEFLDAKVDYSYGSAESVTDYAGQDGEVFVPLAALKNGECIEELFKYIEGLPVTARIIKQKYYFENMSISEIAASMSINPDEVRSNIAYIKSVVKYAVMKYGGASTGTGRGDNVNTLGAIWYIFSGSTEGLISGELTGRLYVGVSGLGDISVEFYAYQLLNSKLADVPYTVTPGKSLTDTVKTPEKPVIKTESLPDGILNMQYDFMVEADRDDFLSWEVTSGALPEGIALSDEGMLSGIPTESGSFTFGVRASLTAGNIVSDEKQFTLTVLEAPKKLTPTKSSSYTVSGGYVTKVVAETKLSDFVGNFETPEYVKVFGSDGKEITDKNAYVGTGCRVSLMNGDKAVDSADVVVLGDISGDGRLTSVDYLRLRAYFGGDYELSGAYLAAAHIAGRDTVTSVDYLRLRAHFSGDYNIYN